MLINTETRGRGVRAPGLIFITGTDTGVGKTVLTSLLLCHLRQSGRQALALKPFCSGSRADARLLHSLQTAGASKVKNPSLSLDEINPYYFPEPVAPLVSARKRRRSIILADVLTHIRRAADSFSTPSFHRSAASPVLLIEGAGGLLVPLGEGFTVLDLISALRCETIIVAPNRLGAINHTLLTVRALQAAGIEQLSVVLMGRKRPDPSARSNAKILTELLAPLPVLTLPFLGAASRPGPQSKTKNQKSKILAHILSSLVKPHAPD